MKKILFLILLSTPLTLLRSAEPLSPNDQFTLANQTFEKGDLEKAGEMYHALVNQGFESPELYYNLGNFHYRKGERGKAVLWFERAQLLAPRDSDIGFNLSLSKSHMKEADDNITRRIFLYFTEGETSVALMFFVWVFFGLLGAKTLGWIKNESWAPPALWFSGALLLVAGSWFGISVSLRRQPMAVVINPPGEVRNGPGNDYAVGFTVPEGSEVLLMNRRPDWTQVGVANQGLKGWMPNADLEPLQLTPSSLN